VVVVVVVVVGAAAVVVVVAAAAVVVVVVVGAPEVVGVDPAGVDAAVTDPLHLRLADVLDLTTMSLDPEHVTRAVSPMPSDTELVAAAATP
jgi:hypothetical protein